MTENQGLSLHDIANFGEDVEIAEGRSLRVKGISSYGCLLLLTRFPDLQRWLAGKDLAVEDLVLEGPYVIAAIIAAGTGSPGDTDAEDIAATLPVEVQTTLVEAIYRHTFRSGFGPFVQRVLRLYEGAVASGNFGKDPDMKSPPVSKPLSPPDTPETMSGPTAPDK